jgi:AraC-like DNA-binding protein
MTPGPVRFSTLGLPRARRVAMWEDHNAGALIGLRCRSLGESTLDATEINLQLPRLHLARVIGNPHVVERTSRVIRRTPAEAVACYLTLVGEAFFYHDGGVRILRPGQLIICDADKPFLRGFSQGLEELAVKVPRAVFTEATGLAAVPEPLVRGFAAGTARTLAQLVGRAVRVDGAQPVDEDTVLALLGALVTGRPGGTAAHLATAKAYIEARLTDPDLTAARIARAAGISERHLSRVFAASGTSVPRYLLTRRLDRARALLRAGGATSAADVAARCGFGSAGHFSHAFKEHFGVRVTDALRDARIRQRLPFPPS